MSGKRKRTGAVVSRRNRMKSETDQSSGDSHEIFRKYFESRFEPLLDIALPTPSLQQKEYDPSSEDTSEESEWDGVSDAETTVNPVEVVEHGSLDSRGDALLDGVEVKTFMTTKPPNTGESRLKAVTRSQTETDEMEDANLKNDLDLQRLLQESALLKKEKEGSRADRNRKTDLRLQALGLKSSMYTQEKMPMAHRQGMKAKAHLREEFRRKDARDNGVILEKANKKPHGDKPKRERGVDSPGVGKFRGGTLKLSRRDVSDIQGPKQSSRGRRKI